MTCPGFRERDAALRQMMGPPTAQQYLHSSMGYPRWDLLPVEPVKPRISNVTKTQLLIWGVLIGVPLAGVALLSMAKGVF
jgi:hypothetical protein